MCFPQISDLGRLLNFYQLWLDDLYPRAKFADGLAIIEKLGHSKRIQIMRKEWIDEEKPNYHSTDHDTFASSLVSPPVVPPPVNSALAGSNTNASTNNAPPDDDLDMLLAEAEAEGSNHRGRFAPNNIENGLPNNIPPDDVPPDDDLDMLLAEAENNEPFVPRPNTHSGLESNNQNMPQDDEDALDRLLAEAETLDRVGKS
jgi:replication fork protection complex subunit Csm3/Swi3